MYFYTFYMCFYSLCVTPRKDSSARLEWSADVVQWWFYGWRYMPPIWSSDCAMRRNWPNYGQSSTTFRPSGCSRMLGSWLPRTGKNRPARLGGIIMTYDIKFVNGEYIVFGGQPMRIKLRKKVPQKRKMGYV